MTERKMVERIARVIAAAALRRRCQLAGFDPLMSEQARIVLDVAEDFLWREHDHTARDVLDVMREPTGGMIEAGCAQAKWPVSTWRAMIGAAELEDAD